MKYIHLARHCVGMQLIADIEHEDDLLRLRLTRHWLGAAQSILAGYGETALLSRLYHDKFTHPLALMSFSALEDIFTVMQAELHTISRADNALQHLTEMAFVYAMLRYESLTGRKILPDNGKVRAHYLSMERYHEQADAVRQLGPDRARQLYASRTHERATAIRATAKHISLY